MMPMKLLIFGSLNIDHTYRLPHLVRPGETLASTAYQKNAGGKGLNQAIALARAGQAVCFAGAIGEDGQFLARYLQEQGVDVSSIQTLPVPTGHALIQVDAQGANSIILYGGANQSITEGMLDTVLSRFSAGDFLLMQNEISNGEVLLRKAHARGMCVLLNPSPASAQLRSWPLEMVDWLILNEVEGEDLTGCAQPEAILHTLLQRYPKMRIVLTLGSQGALYADALQTLFQPAIPCTVQDTTAAGDTFTGYFFAAILRGQPVAEALHLAAQAASLAVSRAGAGASIPTRDEVLEKISR